MAENSFLIKLGLNADEIATGLTKATSQISNFSEQIVELGKGLGAAFAIERVAEFGFQISELAAKAAGVKQAFSELPNSVALLAQLNNVTHDTVDNLDLMGKAVHAENLGIPLENLGTLLEFVHVRAIATNGDFNEMSDILLKSIGRGGAGAKKAMAELQISSEEYTKALHETGNTGAAVMKIAEEAIAKAKGKMDDTLHAIESNKKAWDDLKVTAGETLNESGLLSMGLTFISNKMKVLNSDTLSWYQKLLAISGGGEKVALMLDALLKKQEAIKKSQEDWNTALAQWNGIRLTGIDVIAKKIETERSLEEQIKRLKEEELDADGQGLVSIQKQIEQLQKKLELLKLSYALERDSAESLLTGGKAGGGKVAGPKGYDLSKVVVDYKNMATQIKQVSVDMSDGIAKALNTTGDEIAKIDHGYEALAVSVGTVMGSMVSSHESFSQTLISSIPKIITALATLAIGEVMASAAQDNTTNWNPYLKVAAIAAFGGIAAGMFAKLGSGVSGPGGGGGVGGLGVGAYSGKTITSSLGDRVMTIKFQPISGTMLQAVLTNQQRIDNKVTGG